MYINDVEVTLIGTLPKDEVLRVVEEEKAIFKADGKTLGAITITVDGEFLNIESKEKSPIIRVRRITGYLSNMEKFNDAKREELKDRVEHDCNGCGGCCV